MKGTRRAREYATVGERRFVTPIACAFVERSVEALRASLSSLHLTGIERID